MATFSAIIPVCIIALSGCALFDTAEMSKDPAPLSDVAVADAAPSVEDAKTDSVPQTAPSAIYSVTAEDVRRVQIRLREVGFDPGPVDGVAGTKTNLAFSRLQAGCVKLAALDHAHPLTTIHRSGAGDTALARSDVVRIQTELRSAGFNPGTIDGIYGARTKALVAQLPVACRVAKEFHQGLDLAADQPKNQTAGRSITDGVKTSVAQAGTSRVEDVSIAAAQPREDVRVLQLRLRDAGFDPGPFDGIMGTKTRAALAQYEASQRNSKIKTSATTTRIRGQY